MVPALRAALVLMAWAIRRLQGQPIIFSIPGYNNTIIIENSMKTIFYYSNIIFSIL